MAATGSGLAEHARNPSAPNRGQGRSYKKTVHFFCFFTLTFMAPEATPEDETAPLFVFDPAMPAMGGGRILNRRRQRKGPIAGMARSYTGEKRACFTLTFMAVAPGG